MSALRGIAALSLWVIFVSACEAEQKFSSSAKKKDAEAQAVNTASTTEKELFTGALREPYKVDIIYLLDGSDSMKDNIKKVNDNLKALTENFLSAKQGLDYQLFVISGKPIDIENEKVEFINQYVGSHSALSSAEDFLLGKLKTTKIQMRPDAVKELMVVSDDNASQTPEDFLKFMDDHPDVAAEVRVNGIVAHTACGGYIFGIYRAKVGKTYLELGKNPRTAGVVGNLCESDWGPIFQSLGKNLTEFKVKPKVRLTLKGKPASADKIKVKINGADVPAANVTYEADKNEILLSTETTEQDKIEVIY
jgi:hypothetical protein